MCINNNNLFIQYNNNEYKQINNCQRNRINNIKKKLIWTKIQKNIAEIILNTQK